MQTRLKNRKEQIVDVALDLLQIHGFENFSFLDIANHLSITKASIHHHFAKKEDLGVALCAAIQAWHEKAFAAILIEQKSPRQQLDTYINGMLRFACGKNKVCPLSSLQADINSLPIAMQESLRQLDEHELAFVADVLERGREEKEFQFLGDANAQATVLVLSVKGALQYSRVHGQQLFDHVLAQINILLGSK
ncbi:TetR/AcrR family transcriptional regulator [Thalassotalea euphylliae]|uniref:TetR/AcrR family transcriptional regulator n=1 Tax=Thalassotalea euphylliae TaxID=1655234 RepID=UPI00363EC245